MQRVFMSYSFNDSDSLLAEQLKDLLVARDMIVVTGEDLHGEDVGPQIQKRIRGCKALVALMTKRDPLSNGGFTTHAWVASEFNHAVGIGLPTLVLIDAEVRAVGALEGRERIVLDPNNSLPALLKTNRSLAAWARTWARQRSLAIIAAISFAVVAGGSGTLLFGKVTPAGIAPHRSQVQKAAREYRICADQETKGFPCKPQANALEQYCSGLLM